MLHAEQVYGDRPSAGDRRSGGLSRAAAMMWGHPRRRTMLLLTAHNLIVHVGISTVYCDPWFNPFHETFLD
jgi:hypothetical protein